MTASSFVDSNVIIYAYEKGEKSNQARACLMRLVDTGALVISPQVVAEAYVNLSRVLGKSIAHELVSNLVRSARVWPQDTRSLNLAFEVHRRYGVSYWDAQIIACARLAEAPTLLTEDLQDGQTIEGVTIVNPFREGFDLTAL